jgi:hypothetical protein
MELVRAGDAYIFGFSRSGDGTLTDLNIAPAIPTAPKGGYCPYLTAADNSNHVAISLTPMMDGLTPIGAARIAVYTADSSGDLTTNSTSANMPKAAVGTVTDMKMSPSGRVLAIAGAGGLQVFHFNGANPVTAFTGLMTRDEVDQMFWDDANHLYASAVDWEVICVYRYRDRLQAGAGIAVFDRESVRVGCFGEVGFQEIGEALISSRRK